MDNPGNILAPLALLAWFPFTLLLFARYRPTVAGTISLVGGAMFLPEKVRFLAPIFPDLDKTVIPVIATFIGCMWKARNKVAENRPLAMDWCLLIMAIGQIGIWRTNQDWLIGDNAPLPRPGLTAYDAIGGIASDIVIVFGMFWLGRTLIARAQDVVAALRTFFALGMIYTVFCLVEVRASPQMNAWIYGFAQHDFLQTIRGGGFRPMVFMSHGLVLARFMVIAALSGLLLWRLNLLSSRGTWGLPWISIVLVLCKSTGATILFILFTPFMTLIKSANQARFAAALAVFVALYPLLRGLDMVPVDDMLEMARKVSQDRADSLQVRFDNEALLLERARERVWFGWGGFDRHQKYDPYGKTVFIVDGEWIVVFVSRGVVGFVGYFGFYILPVVYALRRLRGIGSNDFKLMLGGLMLMSVLLSLETLPNSSGTLPQFYWAGALVGAARGLAREDAVRKAKLREQKRRPAPVAAPAPT